MVIFRALLIAVVSFVLGGLTSVGQQFLPDEVNSLANSAGSWVIICFAVIYFSKTRGWIAAPLGIVAFIALNEGYGLVTRLKGFDYGIGFDNIWTLIAIVAGPVVGLAAAWLRSSSTVLRALGSAVPSAVLMGEGVFGLLYVSDTTSPVYWTADLIVGVLLVLALAVFVVRSAIWGVISVVLAAFGGALFLYLFSSGLV